jgi:uncharacterized membrane protein YeaQ/YmgE (transglycosylase-associated protein family)
MVGDAGLADDIGGRFDHVLVDEYQDTNRLQSSILLALKPGGRGLTVVGDDAQSIYSFRAAVVSSLTVTIAGASMPSTVISVMAGFSPPALLAAGLPPLATTYSTISLLGALDELSVIPKSDGIDYDRTTLNGVLAMNMSGESLLVTIIIGVIAGWLAGQLVRGAGFGLIGDLLIGIVGAFIGAWLLPRLGIHLGVGMVSAIINATIGAVILLLIVRLVRGGTGMRSRWRY